MVRPLLVALLILGIPSLATANTGRLATDPPDTAQCVTHAAQTFRVPELPLWALLDVEGGRVGAVSRNTNGSYDIGPMQINSTWLPTLGRSGISERMVRDNLCMNIYVGTWIFAKELQRHGGDMPKAFATYHSPTPRFQYRYLGLIQSALEKRVGRMKQEAALARGS